MVTGGAGFIGSNLPDAVAEHGEQTGKMLTEIEKVLLKEKLFCSTQTAVDNLIKEGITKGVHLVGDGNAGCTFL